MRARASHLQQTNKEKKPAAALPRGVRAAQRRTGGSALQHSYSYKARCHTADRIERPQKFVKEGLKTSRAWLANPTHEVGDAEGVCAYVGGGGITFRAAPRSSQPLSFVRRLANGVGNTPRRASQACVVWDFVSPRVTAPHFVSCCWADQPTLT